MSFYGVTIARWHVKGVERKKKYKDVKNYFFVIFCETFVIFVASFLVLSVKYSTVIFFEKMTLDGLKAFGNQPFLERIMFVRKNNASVSVEILATYIKTF